MDALETLIVTFNCGRQLVKPKILAEHLVRSLATRARPELIIISLQEIAPIGHAFLGGSFLTQYFEKIQSVVDLTAMSLGGIEYASLITRNVGMTAIMIFIEKESESKIRWVETAGVGFGMHEMGNKGAVGVRLGYAVSNETLEATFVAVHLAPMEYALQRRNQDWESTVRGLIFTPGSIKNSRKGRHNTRIEDTPLLQDSTLGSQMYTPTSHLFLAGDLNYRTSQTKPCPGDYSLYPRPVESTNQSHFSRLFKHDQLTAELKAQKTCHGLSEDPINFPPTYKYSNAARAVMKRYEETHTQCPEKHWVWAKHRWPSWCDRILYLGAPPWTNGCQIKTHAYTSLPLMSTSDHRAVILSFSIPLKPITPPDDTEDDLRLSPPYPTDPLWAERRDVARRREIIVGIFAYLGLTWEGNGLLLVLILGAGCGWVVFRSLTE